MQVPVSCRRRLLGIWTLLLLSSCGSSGPTTYPVQGVVYLDGEPLANAIATFIPVSGGRPASGVTDSDGEFELSTFTVKDGALPGDYKVSVMPKEPPPMPGETVSSPENASGSAERKTNYTPPFPTHYSVPDTSGFTATVSPEDSNSFEFRLKSLSKSGSAQQ